MSGAFSWFPARRRSPSPAARELRLALSPPDSERLRNLLTELAAGDAAHGAYSGLKPEAGRTPRRALLRLGIPVVAFAVAGVLAWRWTG